MKVIIPSWARPTTIRTHKLLPEGTDYKIVVHSKEVAKWYAQNPSIDPKRIVINGLPYGNALARNWILDNLVEEGEWFIMADDNIDGFWIVHESYYGNADIDTSTFNSAFWRALFDRDASWETFARRAEEDRAEAERRGARLVGYATNDNHYFRAKKYRDVGYVSTKICLIKKDHLRCDDRLMSKVDFEFTAAHLKEHGRVLINNFIFPRARHFEPGGIGTVKERTPSNVFGCNLLMEKYPGMFAYATKSGRQNRSEVKFTFTDVDQVDAWRKKFEPQRTAANGA